MLVTGEASFILLHLSTDEVYGSLGPEVLFREDSPIFPIRPNLPALDTSKAKRELGWALELKSAQGPAAMVRWCLDNNAWREGMLQDRCDGIRLGLV